MAALSDLLSKAADVKLPRLKKPLAKLPFPLRAPSTPLTVEPLPPVRKTGADFDTEWARSGPARAAREILTTTMMEPIVQFLASPSRQGLDRLEGHEGPMIFAANHHSHIDTPVMITSIPEPWRSKLVVGAAADYFFNSRIKGSLAALTIAAFPIERTKVGRKSADLAAELLEDGWSLLIFPEGGRSPDGWGQAFRGGAAYLAHRCDVPVVPVHIEGTARILRKGRALPKPSSTKITFGAPLTIHEGERSAAFAERIEHEVAVLADEVSTDWWSARKRAHAGTTPSLSGPQAGVWRRVWALDDRGSRGSRKSWPNTN